MSFTHARSSTWKVLLHRTIQSMGNNVFLAHSHIPEAPSNRQLCGERGRGTGNKALSFTSELHPQLTGMALFTSFCGQFGHSPSWLLGRSCGGVWLCTALGGTAPGVSSPSLLLLRLGRVPISCCTHRDMTLNAQLFKHFGGTQIADRLLGNLNLRWGAKYCETSFKERFNLAVCVIWGLTERRKLSVANFYRVWNITGY